MNIWHKAMKWRRPALIFSGFSIVILFAVMQFYQIGTFDNNNGLETFSSADDTKNATSIRLYKSPRPLPPLPFANGTGQLVDITAWQGKVVLLNIWATWCFPCREEMPTLDRLQQRLGGKYFDVVALSVDKGGIDKVRKFYDQINIDHLQIYVDQSASASTSLGIFGIPATLLLSPDGKELGRFIGPAEWDSPEMISFLENTITRQFQKTRN